MKPPPPKLLLPKLTEAQVSQQVIGWLATKGWRAVRINRGLADYGERGRVSYGEKGSTDYIMTHPRLPAMYIELKKPGEKIRELQDIYLAIGSRPKVSSELRRELEQKTFILNRQREGYRACWTNDLEEFKKWYEGEND